MSTGMFDNQFHKAVEDFLLTRACQVSLSITETLYLVVCIQHDTTQQIGGNQYIVTVVRIVLHVAQNLHVGQQCLLSSVGMFVHGML